VETRSQRRRGVKGMQVLWGLAGVVVLMAVAYLLSKNRRAINLRTLIGALIIQIAFAVIVLYWDLGQRALRLLTDGVQAVINTSNAGIEFLFGPVLPDEGVAFASLTSVLYYLNTEGTGHERARVAYSGPGRHSRHRGAVSGVQERHRRTSSTRRRAAPPTAPDRAVRHPGPHRRYAGKPAERRHRGYAGRVRGG
jgi:Na+ dependent nucleoside transporter N-terminus